MNDIKVVYDAVRNDVDNALFSVYRFNGTRCVFYLEDGVIVLTRTKDCPGIDWIAKTTWSKYDFDEKTEKAIRELSNAK